MKTETAIKRAGSINKLAELFGCSRQLIQSYKKHGLPAYRRDELERLKPAWFAKRSKRATPAAESKAGAE